MFFFLWNLYQQESLTERCENDEKNNEIPPLREVGKGISKGGYE